MQLQPQIFSAIFYKSHERDFRNTHAFFWAAHTLSMHPEFIGAPTPERVVRDFRYPEPSGLPQCRK